MKIRAIAIFALFLASPVSEVMAWGDEGHEIVAAIAYARLTPAAKKKADALLAADKDALTARDFVSRATWADKWRDSDRNTTRVRYKATQNWHFVDIEIDNPDLDAACFNHPSLPAGTPASAGPADDCVVDKISEFSSELASSSTPQAEKILALKFLLHFVGDLHQPLHSSDHKDRGGNEVVIHYTGSTKPDTLHSYWDTNLVQRLGKDPKAVAVSLSKGITKAKAGEWAKGAPADWAREAFDEAKTVAYDFKGEKTFVDDHGGTGESLDSKYDGRALPVVREQLSRGGVRLATVLNAALK